MHNDHFEVRVNDHFEVRGCCKAPARAGVETDCEAGTLQCLA